MQDYYETLGVRPDASKEEIEAAWRRAVNFWHPDRNKSREAVERLKAVNEARQVLLDDEQRRRYDHTKVYAGGSASTARMDRPSAHGASGRAAPAGGGKRRRANGSGRSAHTGSRGSSFSGAGSSGKQHRPSGSAGWKTNGRSEGSAAFDGPSPDSGEPAQPHPGSREWWQNLAQNARVKMAPARGGQQVVTLFDRRPVFARFVLVPLGLVAIGLAALFTVLLV